MIPPTLNAFLPELVLLAGALALFFVALGENLAARARAVALVTALAAFGAAVACAGQQAVLFDGAYRVDAFSQLFKIVFTAGFGLVLLLDGGLPDIRQDVKPEYYLFVTLSVCGLVMLVSSVDLIALLVALELSAFPLYLLIPMRRERDGQRVQMESAVKYLMFGIAANGVMLFGMSYLFGLTGTTSLATLAERLQPLGASPLVLAGLALTFCGLYYKLAVFPFHFWTPDVYQGASNETTSLVASLPKIGAVAVLVRLLELAPADSQLLARLMTVMAVGSMFYGNLVALVQKDLKRLLGFSGIAHAGYALIGLVALNSAGYAASIYYVTGYAVMTLACFVVICRVSRDGVNASLDDLAGLHQRSPLLAFTLAMAVFALAGVPPFVGFLGKLGVLTAALSQGHLTLVILAVINAAIAIYYYLGIVREVYFRDPGDLPAIELDGSTKAVCVTLIVAMILLGVAPATVLDQITMALAGGR